MKYLLCKIKYFEYLRFNFTYKGILICFKIRPTFSLFLPFLVIFYKKIFNHKFCIINLKYY